MAFLTALGAAVLLIRVGFALYAAGLVRAKNSAGTVMRLVADLCISILAFWAVGAAFLWQNKNGWIWINAELLFGPHGDSARHEMPTVFLNLTMILVATSVVGSAVVERCRFSVLCIVSMILAAVVFPVTGNWIWHGWLARKGFVDLAGASALHVCAGVFAMIAVFVIGPRRGKFNRDGSSSMIPGHNVPLACIGALLIMVGWIAYVVGSSYVWSDPRMLNLLTDFQARFGDSNRALAALAETAELKAPTAAMNVALSAAAAALVTMLIAQIRFGKTDILLTLTGFLGGLVAICAGGSEVPAWAAVVTGAVAGVIVPWAATAIDLRLRLDDPLCVIAIHGVGGAWGTVAAGIFIADPIALATSHANGTIVNEHSRLAQIGIQLFGLVAIALVSALTAMAVFLILKATGKLKIREADEFDGLDLAEHDVGAYPDFQQNSIKSYHLREA